MRSNGLRSLGVFSLKAIISLSSLNAIADQERTYPDVYPFVPFTTEKVEQRAKYMSEDENYINNVFEAHNLGLTNGRTSEQPWMSTYWPLNKGLIADPYYESLQIFRPGYELSWTRNYNRLTDRRTQVHPEIMNLSQKELNKLAPSEKYDILLGDESFDLTNKLRQYMYKWGSEKEYGFLASFDKVSGKALEFANELVRNKTQVWHEGENKVFNSIEEALPYAIHRRGGLTEYFAQQMVDKGEASSIEAALPDAFNKALKEQKNYVVNEKNDYMALWEGICHGWATAAGNVPRPTNTVTFNLPNGKKLNFYPEDIKGIISLLWANSDIQNTKYTFTDQETGEEKVTGGILMEGLRCNQKRPKKDEWGRLYDSVPDYYSKKLEPRCVGVHPAIWHMGLINIIGNQGRSFIVERKVKAAVDNHPMSGYDMQYFNPTTGNYGELSDVVVSIQTDEEKRRDQFRNFRNPETAYIVGIRTTMYYLDWERPDRKRTDSPADDSIVDKTMLYDLELDVDGNIIGGQWRSTEVGKKFLNLGANHDQPDFFWSVTKDFKKTGYFDDLSDISEWEDTTTLPPADWKTKAQSWQAHNNKLYQTHVAGWGEKCEVKHKKTKEIVEVSCEFIIDKPKPLTNVVNKLIELSRQQ